MSIAWAVLLWLGMQGGTPNGYDWPAAGKACCVGCDNLPQCPKNVITLSEPQDVPAIQEKRHEKTGGTINCRAVSDALETCDCEYRDVEVTTCADKSRILLTAEDGTKWCHKPQP
jgi:hypothetical protein